MAVVSLATGALLELSIGPYSGKETGEHALLRQLMPIFKSGDVVLGDRYYGSFFVIAQFMQMGVDVVFPLHCGRKCDFQQGTRLGKKDHLVEWKKPSRPEWMDEETYHHFPDHITVREVEIHGDQDGFRSTTRIVVTTFSDPFIVSKRELGSLYDCRWFIEINLKAIKETMRMDILRAKTPQMVRKEIWAHLLAYNLVRKIMAQSASRHHKNPREMSFKLALQVLSAFRQAGLLSEKDDVIYGQLLKAIAYKKVGNRRGRSEPRRVKRRPKAFSLLRKPRSFYKKTGSQA